MEKVIEHNGSTYLRVDVVTEREAKLIHIARGHDIANYTNSDIYLFAELQQLDMERSEAEKLKTWPDEIFLVFKSSFDDHSTECMSYEDALQACGRYDYIQWCADRINDSDIRYIRADLTDLED
jgi:hypothetical protein